MQTIRLWVYALALGGAFGAWASSPSPCAETTGPRPARWEAGLAIETLMPSRLPQFSESLPAYGLLLAAPFLSNSLVFNASYAGSPQLVVRLFSLAYRIPLETPYLSGFAFAGVHLLNYTAAGNPFTYAGPNLGLGITLPMGEGFALDALMRAYFQTTPMVAMGGAFRIAL